MNKTFTDQYLVAHDFEGDDLAGADFTDTTLHGADLSDALLDTVYLNGALVDEDTKLALPERYEVIDGRATMKGAKNA